LTAGLHARSYNPNTLIGTQADPYWNNSNMQSDPLAILQSANLYVYCINNPVHYRDPSGLSAKKVADEQVKKSTIYYDTRIPTSPIVISAIKSTTGNNIDLGRGWTARIERGVSPNTQRHVHVFHNSNGSWSQNEDGSPHDRGGNSPGNPPRRVLDRLQDRTGWDWRGNQGNWVGEITRIEHTDVFVWDSPRINYSEIIFPDGTIAYLPYEYSIGGRASPAPAGINVLLILYAEAELALATAQPGTPSYTPPIMMPVLPYPSGIPTPSLPGIPMPRILIPIRIF
jgi:RHS repeat-associated protein